MSTLSSLSPSHNRGACTVQLSRAAGLRHKARRLWVAKADRGVSSSSTLVTGVSGQEEIQRNGWSVPNQELHPLVPETVAACARIYQAVERTPLERSTWLSDVAGCTAWIKLENKQVTGSFKARGAVNKAFSLSDAEIDRGLLTSSTGNHALAFVHACQALSEARQRTITPLIYLPTTASATKAAKLRQQGAQLVMHGKDCVEAELAARQAAADRGAVYVSPYNDLQIAAGQGTIAVELLQALHRGQLDTVFVPVGGGGLISGIAATLKAVSADIRIVGCQPAASDVMRQSVQANRIVDAPSSDTLSDGTAGGIEPGSMTLEPCMRFVDEWITVAEPEIAAAMVAMHEHHGMNVEGAAGMVLAAACKSRAKLAGKHAVVVCCGGNVSPQTCAQARQLAMST